MCVCDCPHLGIINKILFFKIDHSQHLPSPRWCQSLVFCCLPSGLCPGGYLSIGEKGKLSATGQSEGTARV